MIYLEREGGCSFFNIVRNLVRLSEKCCNDVLWQKCDKGFLETLHSCNSTKAVMVALLKILAPRLVTIFACYTVLPRPGKGMVNILFVFEIISNYCQMASHVRFTSSHFMNAVWFGWCNGIVEAFRPAGLGSNLSPHEFFLIKSPFQA